MKTKEQIKIEHVAIKAKADAYKDEVYELSASYRKGDITIDQYEGRMNEINSDMEVLVAKMQELNDEAIKLLKASNGLDYIV